MNYEKSFGRIAFKIVNGIILLGIAFACLIPVIHVLFGSLTNPANLANHKGVIFWPQGFTLKGYELVFQNPNVVRSYLNTLFYVITATSLSVLLTVCGGYGLSRKNLLWKKPIMFMITLTMLFNGGLVPFYLVVKHIGLIYTRGALIIPTAVSVFNLIIMRTSMMEIPESFEESAKMDGADHFTILFQIFVPLSKAVIAVIVLFYTITNWNSWFNALIFLKDRNLYPLQLILREILIQNESTAVMQGMTDYNMADLYKQIVKYSIVMVATLPILCVYPFVQRYFVTGVMIGSIKG